MTKRDNMDEQEDLKAYIERTTEERMRRLGFTLVWEEPKQKEGMPVTGTITFLKGESAKKAAKYFQKKKDADGIYLT